MEILVNKYDGRIAAFEFVLNDDPDGDAVLISGAMESSMPMHGIQTTYEVVSVDDAKIPADKSFFSHRYENGEIIPVAKDRVVPQSVDMAQARLALLDAGYLDDVEAAMAGMPKSAQIEWEFRTTVARSSSLVQAVAQLLSLTESQIDDLFILAGEK